MCEKKIEKEIYEIDNWIGIMIENITSIQDKIDDLNYKKHIEVKNINDVKSLSEAQKSYILALESLERTKKMKLYSAMEVGDIVE